MEEVGKWFGEVFEWFFLYITRPFTDRFSGSLQTTSPSSGSLNNQTTSTTSFLQCLEKSFLSFDSTTKQLFCLQHFDGYRYKVRNGRVSKWLAEIF